MKLQKDSILSDLRSENCPLWKSQLDEKITLFFCRFSCTDPPSDWASSVYFHIDFVKHYVQFCAWAVDSKITYNTLYVFFQKIKLYVFTYGSVRKKETVWIWQANCSKKVYNPNSVAAFFSSFRKFFFNIDNILNVCGIYGYNLDNSNFFSAISFLVHVHKFV